MGFVAVFIVNVLCLIGYDYIKTKNPEKMFYQTIIDKVKSFSKD